MTIFFLLAWYDFEAVSEASFMTQLTLEDFCVRSVNYNFAGDIEWSWPTSRFP